MKKQSSSASVSRTFVVTLDHLVRKTEEVDDKNHSSCASESRTFVVALDHLVRKTEVVDDGKNKVRARVKARDKVRLITKQGSDTGRMVQSLLMMTTTLFIMQLRMCFTK
jgi:hypothetical protein